MPDRITAEHEPAPGAKHLVEPALAQQSGLGLPTLEGVVAPPLPPPSYPTAQVLRRAQLRQHQRSAGNQAVQRQIQRDGASLPPVPNYQLTPPSLQVPGPRRPSLLGGDGPHLRLDPQIEAELRAMQIRAALSPATIRPQLGQLPIGPIRLPPPGPVGQPGTPQPAPQPAPQPQPRVGEQGEPPRPGTGGDILKAIVERPEVEALLSRAGDHALMQWQQLRLGGQVTFVSVSALIAGGAIAATPDARRFVFQQLSGTALPVPGVSWLRVEMNVADDNLMFGLHLDMSRFLPTVLGFGPGSPEAMGGPPQLEDAPGPPSLRRSPDEHTTASRPVALLQALEQGEQRMPDHNLPDHERLAARRAPHSDTPQAESGPATHPLLALQRQVGNAQIARMLAQRASADDEEEVLQRQEVEEEELQLARAAPEVGPEGGPVSDATASRIESLRGGGSALDQGARAEMEGSLGDSFADVRVHTGGEAHQLNRSLGAKAFTTGSDLFFAEGASPADKGLLAHELTHVTQQRGMAGAGPMSVGPADDAYEAAAEASSAAVSSGAAPAAQRKPEE